MLAKKANLLKTDKGYTQRDLPLKRLMDTIAPRDRIPTVAEKRKMVE